MWNFKKGSSMLETILAISIITIFSLIFYPIFKINIYLRKTLNEKSSDKKILILIENIGDMILSTTIESEEKNNYLVKNKGIAILKLENRNLTNINLNVSQYIVKNGEEGDAVYIEIPEVCVGEKIAIKNQFYIYRFFKNSSQSKNSNQIRFVKGRDEFVIGNREEILKLGKEEILNSDIKNAVFREVNGGIEIIIETENQKKYKEIFLKVGGT